MASPPAAPFVIPFYFRFQETQSPSQSRFLLLFLCPASNRTGGIYSYCLSSLVNGVVDSKAINKYNLVFPRF